MTKVVGTLQNKARIWNGAIPGTHEPGFVEQPIIEDTKGFEVLRQQGLDVRVFRMGECGILLGLEPGGVNGEERWHLTISCFARHPTWDEIKTARYRLLGPDIPMAMILPPAQFYVNVEAQDHVFQLWEIEDPARIWESG